MQTFKRLTMHIPLLTVLVLLCSCSLIPNTDKANVNIHQELVPQYIAYVQNDNTLSDTQKSKDIDYAKTADFRTLCANVVPYYVNYVRANKTLSDAEKQAYINEAKSYQLVNERYK